MTRLAQLLAALLFALTSATALAGAPKLTCTPDPATGLCVPPPTVSCIPPLLWSGSRCECPDGGQVIMANPDGTFVCAAPTPPPPACTITISYPADRPATATASLPAATQCDRAGAELAMS